MSRLFNGTTDLMTFAPTDWAFGTLLVVVKIVATADNTWMSFIEGEDSGGNLKYGLGRRNTGNLNFSDGVSAKDAIAITDSDGWMICAVTKATGTVAPILHKLPIGGTRTSTTFGGTSVNIGSIAGGHVKFGGDDDMANIKLAAVAIFNGTVLTTTQLDGILSAKTTASIAALSPTALYDDSDAFATDLIGSADRTAISGTTDDVDDPSGWVYGLGGGGTDATVSAFPADAIGDVPAPGVQAGSTVTAPALDAVGAVPVPVVAGGSTATVASAVCSSAGRVVAPAVDAGSSVAAAAADAVGDVLVAVAAVSAEVTTGPQSGTGAVVAPVVQAGGGATVSAAPADATGDVPAPTVGADATVSAAPADATGDVVAPAVTWGADVAAAPADAIGDVVRPTVAGDEVLVDETPLLSLRWHS